MFLIFATTLWHSCISSSNQTSSEEYTYGQIITHQCTGGYVFSTHEMMCKPQAKKPNLTSNAIYDTSVKNCIEASQNETSCNCYKSILIPTLEISDYYEGKNKSARQIFYKGVQIFLYNDKNPENRKIWKKWLEIKKDAEKYIQALRQVSPRLKVRPTIAFWAIKNAVSDYDERSQHGSNHDQDLNILNQVKSFAGTYTTEYLFKQRFIYLYFKEIQESESCPHLYQIFYAFK